MSGKQTTNGKAFEYACIFNLNKIINKYPQITSKIIKDNQYNICKKHFKSLSKNHKEVLIKGGFKLAEKLVMLEPRLIFSSKGMTDNIELTIQSDEKGKKGDVRDIIAIRIKAKAGWEIGISCKHGHKALKHQRISPHIDIGKEWLLFPCDKQYKQDIKAVFDLVKSYKNEGKKEWSEIINKDKEIYEPTIKAVKSFLERFYKKHGKILCENLLTYIIGKEDFYKVIIQYKKRNLLLQGFNFNNTLNKKADNNQPYQKIPKLHKPSKFYSIGFKKDSKNTLLLVMDEGWQISMRIHNARTDIENSLKIDAQLIGNPSNLFNETINLDDNLER